MLSRWGFNEPHWSPTSVADLRYYRRGEVSREVVMDLVQGEVERLSGSREGHFVHVRGVHTETVITMDPSGYRPPDNIFVTTFLVVPSGWRSTSPLDIRERLSSVKEALERINVTSRVKFVSRGGCRRFPYKSRFVVPLLDRYVEYRMVHDMLMPPRFTPQHSAMLKQAGIKPRVGLVENRWVLHLDDEEQYLFAKLLF